MLNLKVAAFADEASKSFDAQIRAMARNDISLLEVRFVDEENISVVSCEKAKLMRSKLDDNGMSVWSIGSPTGKISLKDEFGPHLDQFRHQLELANILGAQHYRLFSFYDYDDSQACFDLVCERLNGFLDAARGTDVILCHENEKGIYGDIAERCVKIHKALPELKAVFDPANFMQCGEVVLSAWDRLAPYVEYLHIKDYGIDFHSGNPVMAPIGSGNLNWHEIISTAETCGVKYFIVEHDGDVLDPFESFETSFNYLKKNFME